MGAAKAGTAGGSGGRKKRSGNEFIRCCLPAGGLRRFSYPVIAGPLVGACVVSPPQSAAAAALARPSDGSAKSCSFSVAAGAVQHPSERCGGGRRDAQSG